MPVLDLVLNRPLSETHHITIAGANLLDLERVLGSGACRCSG